MYDIATIQLNHKYTEERNELLQKRYPKVDIKKVI